jgi:hypothetical protein
MYLCGMMKTTNGTISTGDLIGDPTGMMLILGLGNDLVFYLDLRNNEIHFIGYRHVSECCVKIN